ncbi:MAG TPA: hypothetical protein VHX19_18070 [Stellaceae bacterium]|nr:hypothetical protein [Stellaceae bacterium]
MIVNTLIVGGGPAGLAPLVSASRSGLLDRILADGVAIAERGMTIGAGRIGYYAVRSDSTGNTLTSCITENPHPALAALRDHPLARAVAAYRAGSVPLSLVGEFMGLLGDTLRNVLVASGNDVFLGHEAISSKRLSDGFWRTKLKRLADGADVFVESRFVVMATGGHQPLSYLRRRSVGGRPLLPSCADKLIQSDEALTAAGLAAIGERLAQGRSKRVAIVGSSSSAMACASAVLQSPFGRQLHPGAVTLLHRRPLHIFYPSAAEAKADGYTEFGPQDICPISGFVYRLSGLRLEARDLLMSVRGIGGRPPEERLRLHQVDAGPDPVALQILDDADVVIAALGYRPLALPLLNASGRRLDVFADDTGVRPLVDGECRVLDRRGAPIEGLLAIGLGSGFFSRELVGGELSFSGQTNSLWQWQNAVGGLVARQIQALEPEKPIKQAPIAALAALPPLQSV